MINKTRDVILNVIYHYCPNKFGFEYAFSQTTIAFIYELASCITNNISIGRPIYDEPVDFIDGNGFMVEGNETNGYVISLLNT